VHARTTSTTSCRRHQRFNNVNTITRDDIVGTWAGLRPLVKSASSGRTADLSRGHNIHRSASGVVTITGGKLTTYRHMAADTVDEVVSDQLGAARPAGPAAAGHEEAPLRGADGYQSVTAAARGYAVTSAVAGTSPTASAARPAPSWR
jgi:glycerol-3-phosphate dehydrogenase